MLHENKNLPLTQDYELYIYIYLILYLHNIIYGNVRVCMYVCAFLHGAIHRHLINKEIISCQLVQTNSN